MYKLILLFPGSSKLTKVKRDFRHRAPRQDRKRISLQRTYIDTKAQLGLLNHFSVSVLAHEFSLLICHVLLICCHSCLFPSQGAHFLELDCFYVSVDQCISICLSFLLPSQGIWWGQRRVSKRGLKWIDSLSSVWWTPPRPADSWVYPRAGIWNQVSADIPWKFGSKRSQSELGDKETGARIRLWPFHMEGRLRLGLNRLSLFWAKILKRDFSSKLTKVGGPHFGETPWNCLPSYNLCPDRLSCC